MFTILYFEDEMYLSSCFECFVKGGCNPVNHLAHFLLTSDQLCLLTICALLPDG